VKTGYKRKQLIRHFGNVKPKSAP